MQQYLVKKSLLLALSATSVIKYKHKCARPRQATRWFWVHKRLQVNFKDKSRFENSSLLLHTITPFEPYTDEFLVRLHSGVLFTQCGIIRAIQLGYSPAARASGIGTACTHLLTMLKSTYRYNMPLIHTRRTSI